MPQSTPPPRPPSHRPQPRQQDFLEIGDEDELDQGYGQDPRYSQSARHTPRQPGFGEEYEVEFYGQRNAQSRPPVRHQDPAYRPQPARQPQSFPRYPEDYRAEQARNAAYSQKRSRENGQPQRTQKKDWRTWVALAALIPALGLAFTIEAPIPLVNWLIAIVAIIIAGVFAWRKDVIKSKSYR